MNLTKTFQSGNWKNIQPIILSNSTLALIAYFFLGNVGRMLAALNVDVMIYFFVAWINFLISRMESGHLLGMNILMQRTDMENGSEV